MGFKFFIPLLVAIAGPVVHQPKAQAFIMGAESYQPLKPEQRVKYPKKRKRKPKYVNHMKLIKARRRLKAKYWSPKYDGWI